MRLGPLPQPATGSRQHPARSFPFRSRRESSPYPRPSVPPPPPRQVAGSTASTELPSGQAPRHCHLPAGFFLSSPFPELRQKQDRQLGCLVKAPLEPKSRHPERASCMPPEHWQPRRGAPRPPALKPQLRFYQTYSKVGFKWWCVRSGGAHLVASLRPRVETGSAGGLTGPTGPHGVTNPALAARAPSSQAAALHHRAQLPGRPERGRSLRLRPRLASAGARFSSAETRSDFPWRPDPGGSPRGPGQLRPACGQRSPCSYSSQLLARK